MNSKPLRIAWFSSLHPDRGFSKSAHVSSIILPLLKNNCQVDVYSNRTDQILGGLETKHFLTAVSQHQQKHYDYFLYNLENGNDSSFARIHLGLLPGVTWFHDFTLLDDGPEPILNSPWCRMLDLFESKPVEWPVRKDLFIPKRPHALREAGMSFFSIFSNERDLELFRSLNPQRLNPGDKGCFLPMPLPQNCFNQKSEASSKKQVNIACVSKPSVDTHIHSILAALKLEKEIKFRWLIDPTDKVKCVKLINEFELDCVELIEGRNIENWSKILKKSDLSIHFLYSFYEQLQPWLNIALAHGKYCATLDFSESQFFPDSVLFKIKTGSAEHLELAGLIGWIRNQSDRSNQTAAGYVLERASADSLSFELQNYLIKLLPQKKNLDLKWQKLQNEGRKNLLDQNFDSDNKKYLSEVFSDLAW